MFHFALSFHFNILVIIFFTGSDALIIQFPYQSISSWGSSPSAFQFTVFNYSTHTENIKNDNENTKYDTENIIREDNKIGGVGVNNNLNNNLNSNINKNESNLLLLPTCQSERTQEFHSEMKKWQDTSFATITDKSDFISTEDSDKKHLQSQQQLQEELEQNDQHLVVDENDGEDVIIILKTTSALLIEQSTMSAVQKLMRDIERSAVSKADFDKLLEDIVDPSTGGLQVKIIIFIS